MDELKSSASMESLACKRRKSDEECVVQMEAEECSESDSPTNSTKNDKSSTDSGICSAQTEVEEKVMIGDNEKCADAEPQTVTTASATTTAEEASSVDEAKIEEEMESLVSAMSEEGNTPSGGAIVENGSGTGNTTTEENRSDMNNFLTTLLEQSLSSALPVENEDGATAESRNTDEHIISDGTSPITMDVATTDESNQLNSSSDSSNDSFSQRIRYIQEDIYPSTTPELQSDDDEDEDDNDDDDEDGNEEDIREKKSQSLTEAIKEVLNYPKPPYSWNSTRELMRREHGLSGDGPNSLRNGTSGDFNSRFYASRHVIERMKRSHCLREHRGCVNCLNFNRSGELLCSGSDDTRIIIWNWAQNKSKHTFKSGHTGNIFQTKFIDSGGCLDIVSASRDGQVRRSIIPPSGGKPQSSLLYRHERSVHKIVVSPRNPFEILSAGEDGVVLSKDLRNESTASTLCKVINSKNRKVRLFSISHNPFAPEICVCGSDTKVRVYDKRNPTKPVREMFPANLKNLSQVTCSVYNSTGSEILSSYSDDNIYLFDNKSYVEGEYLHRYRGHFNHKTIKGVNFCGPNSEYVISGSDCGNIFIWDKNTEAILNFMHGDSSGVVNCLEPHPSIPVLATSGLDSNIKIWTPSSETYPPDLSKLESCVKHNLRRSVMGEKDDFDGTQLQYFIRQFLRRRSHPSRTSFLFEESLSNYSSNSSSSSSDDERQSEPIQCRTQ